MGIRKGTILIAMMALAASSHGEYTLKLSRGKYPEGVKTENLNGNIPQSSWYKNGWTEDGWSAGDYGTSYNIAVSPSGISGGICENALILPSMLIEEGEWLSWEGCEIYPKFCDDYTVEFRAKDTDTWVTIGEYTESKSRWTTHMVDLSPFYGLEGNLRFVCRSENGYMLGLNNISIKKPTEYSFSSENHTPKFFAIGDLDEGNAMAEISVMNTGVAISTAVVAITIDGNPVSTLSLDKYWPTGETRQFQLPIPLTLNERADYALTLQPFESEMLTIDTSFAFCTSFKRNLYVDKGTGMWCNACPNGTLSVEELADIYGDALIVGETHYDDPIANEIDFKWLNFHSIPQLMLNRVLSTKGDNASKFENQICLPTEMEINITDLSVKSNGDLFARAEVKTSEFFSDTRIPYCIGYMLTQNVNGDENVQYYQKNICTTARQKQYRYLPSTMYYLLCSFPNVTIPSRLATLSENPAFTGIKGSLPESLASGEIYNYEWEIPLPEGFDNFNGMRLVAFILDSEKRTIINSTASYIDDYTGIEEISDYSATQKTEKIFTIDGVEVKADKQSLLPGLYIVNGKKILIK